MSVKLENWTWSGTSPVVISAIKPGSGGRVGSVTVIKSVAVYVSLPPGPSTVRDGIGTLASVLGGDPWYNVTVKNDTQHFKDSDYYISKGTDGINFRSKNIDSFNNLEQNSMDFYASVRSLYIQDRKQKIINSNKIVETQDDSDWDDLQSN